MTLTIFIPDDVSEPLRDTSYAADGYTCYDCVHCNKEHAKPYCFVKDIPIDHNNCRLACDTFKKGN